MKYKNITELLPLDLVNQIQNYIQGEYVYIPIREKGIDAPTDYKVELQKRDEQIYLRFLEGLSRKQLAVLYNLSESSIRRIIIKQKEGYVEMQEDIMQVLKNWEITNREIEQIYPSAWLIGKSFVLKVYDNYEMLERNVKIMKVLLGQNIPVAKVIPTVSNVVYAEENGAFFIMTERLPGSNLVQFDKNYEMATQMGKIIGDLHVAFRECEKQEEFWNNSLLEELKGWIQSSFEKHGWKYVPKSSFEMLVSELESLYDKLSVQLIHRDVHFGNFLFHEGEFSGYIDFDLSQRNIRIFDLCYFLLGLLSEEEKLELSYEQWFEIVKKVFAGYEEKQPLLDAEKRAVPYVMEAIELLFAAWFTDNDNVCCAENAMKLYTFVKENETKIWNCV